MLSLLPSHLVVEYTKYKLKTLVYLIENTLFHFQTPIHTSISQQNLTHRKPHTTDSPLQLQLLRTAHPTNGAKLISQTPASTAATPSLPTRYTTSRIRDSSPRGIPRIRDIIPGYVPR